MDVNGPPKSLNEIFKFIFESKKDSDVTFVIHGKELQAHKIIVTSRSPVFEAMINNDLAPKDGKHLINDPKITYEDFENFLLFLYTDKFTKTDDNIGKLLYLSIFYQVEFLTQECINAIKTDLTAKNIFKYAELGLLFSDVCSLLDICISNISNFFDNSFSLTYWINNCETWISPELAIKFVEKCPRNKFISEDQVFKKIFAWAAKSKDEQVELTDEARTTLKSMKPYIKFYNLEPLTLATIVRDNNLLESIEFTNAISEAIKSSNKKGALINLQNPGFSGVYPQPTHYGMIQSLFRHGQ